MKALIFCLILFQFAYSDVQELKKNLLNGIGVGWDILENSPKFRIFQNEYKKKKMTDDEKYLIPDCAGAYAKKLTQYDESGEIIITGRDFSSLTSKSTYIGFSIEKKNFTFAGSYSKEYIDINEKNSAKNSITLRINYAIIQYLLFASTKCKLDPDFVDRINEITKYVKLGDNEVASYLSQLLIKDYGTHFVNEIALGGMIYKEDQISIDYWKKIKYNKNYVQSVLNFNFRKYINLNISNSNLVNRTMVNEYASSLRSTKISAFGGSYDSIYDINKWSQSLEKNLVQIDRKAILITELISYNSFPDIDQKTLIETKRLIDSAINTYIEINTRYGCMDRFSDNYDAYANYEDSESCKNRQNNEILKFGGLYSMYEYCTAYDSSNNCIRKSYYCNGGYNIFQGNYSCPNGYESSLVFSKKFENKYYLNMYQCVGQGNSLEINRGVYFGGIYSQLNDNPLTSKKSCPKLFKAYKLHCGTSSDYICLSLDEKAKDTSVLFGGIYSVCSPNGNIFSNGSFSCPRGYQKEFINSNYNCDIYYCFDSKASINKVYQLTRPPFMAEPLPSVNSDNKWIKFIYIILFFCYLIFIHMTSDES